MKKVLILSNSSSGLYELRRELVQDISERNEVYISLPEDEEDKYMIEFNKAGYKVIHTPFSRRGLDPLSDSALYRAYKSLMLKIKPDMVLTYTIKPNIYGGYAAKRLGIPYITNFTGLGTAILNGGLLSRVLIKMYGISTSGARCIFFQNASNMEYMMSKGIKGKGNVRLLPGSGVNLNSFSYCDYPSEDNGIEILSVMRIMRDKGIEELLYVIDKLGKPGKVHFNIAGRYEEETRQIYEPVVNKMIEQGKLTFLGYISDMKQVYDKNHIIVHPSYHEGLSNVCLEAAACGRPVITTDIPGCRETVGDESGILCQPRSAESLKIAIEKMLALTTDDRKAMGIAGRTHVEEKFDRNIVINAYREYI